MGIITNTKITALSFPLKKPFSNHLRQITHIKGMVLQIYTDEGIIGQGFVYGLSDMPYQEVADIISAIVLHIPTENDIQPWMNAWQKQWHLLKAKSHTQAELTALSIVDIAIWDVFLKARNISLHQYLGGAQEKIPVYGTTGWLSFSLEELIAECEEYREKEVRAFKIRIGHKEDYRRIECVRAAMGAEFILMLDANQCYTADEAIKLAEDFYLFNLAWLEEPTQNNLEEIKRLKKYSKLPLALGENIIKEEDFKVICQEKLTDILQPDLPRCGGITGFIAVIELALKHDMPVCNHLLYELSLSIVAAYKNGHMIEYDNLLPSNVLTTDFKVVAGYIVPPNIPGTGVELRVQALKEYAVGVVSTLTYKSGV